MFYNNADLVLDNTINCGSLWLGNYKAALDADFLLENNITVIVNATPDIPFIHEILDTEDLAKFTKLDTYRVPVYDSLLNHDIYLMEQYYHALIPVLLRKLLVDKQNILIHCHQGVQRSASIVAALLYIIKHDKLINTMDTDEIQYDVNNGHLMRNVIDYIVKKRSKAFTFGYRINFKKSLERFFNIKF
jgi:hypothetical protein